MEKKIRLSPSFLNSFAYYKSIEDDDMAAEKRQEIICQLRGMEIMNDAMQRGISMENSLVSYMADKKEGRDIDAATLMLPASLYDELAGYVSDSIYQPFLSRPLCHGVDIIGYADFIRENIIYDLKTTKRYRYEQYPKFQDSYQHRIYLTCMESEGIRDFKYLIVDFDNENLVVEHYTWNDSYMDDIMDGWRQVAAYLGRDDEMREAFEKKHGVKISEVSR